MNSNRYVLVAIDKDTGEISISPEMLDDKYSKEEVEEIISFMPKALKTLRDFYAMEYDKAIALWTYERNDSQRENSKTIN